MKFFLEIFSSNEQKLKNFKEEYDLSNKYAYIS